MLSQYSGYLSGIFMTVAFIPYIVGILRHETRPERASWFIWALLGGISFFTQLVKGATHSLWLPATQGLGDLVVFFFATKYGMGGMQKRDKIALCAVVISLILWYVTNEPAVALFVAIFIDATGGLLTMIKSYEHPTTEPILAWVLNFLSGFFAILAVGNFNLVLLAFPVYIFLINLAITGAILLGRQKA
ncbi:MAG: hypothetical protein PHV93_03115 [Candidatus Pacebacteria bacterium]|nr:hypothetical protein [Candidatus Paceibacterota bacterium]